MSIVRVSLAETKNFSDGYDLIFGKKSETTEQQKTEQTEKQTAEEKPQAKETKK